jgi:hypothetical protein
MSSSGEELFQIRQSKFGKGLFAVKDIPPETFICKVIGEEITFEDTLTLGDKESFALQIDSARYVLCNSPFLFSNHSCNPNCAVNSDLDFHTISEVKKDQELLWDYSTSMLERHWTMNCYCGSDNCRKLITDFDLLPLKVQKKYLQMHIVLPFILNQLNYRIVSPSVVNVIKKSA